MNGLPIWLEAGLWGLLGGSALVIGAAIAYVVRLPRWVTTGVMAFGSGVLFSAVAYDLILEGFEAGGFRPIVIGALAGALAYTIADVLVSSRGGHHRKHSGDKQASAQEGGAAAIAVGSMLDGVPESVVLGVSLVSGGGLSVAMLAAIFLSNLPEGLSSASGMRTAGRKPGFVLGLWTGIALLSGFSALLGAAFLAAASPVLLATVNAVAAGALLAMVVNTMVPEAVEGEGPWTGMLVVAGLLLAFAISHGDFRSSKAAFSGDVERPRLPEQAPLAAPARRPAHIGPAAADAIRAP